MGLMDDSKRGIDIMQQNYQISLNFFPLKGQEFQFIVYRKPYNGERSEDGFEECQRIQELPEDKESST